MQMADLKKLDELNKPNHEDNNSWKTTPNLLNKSNPEFMKPEKIAKTLLATGAKPRPAPTGKPAPAPVNQKDINLAKHRKIRLYVQEFPQLEQNGIRVPSSNASSAELDEVLFDIHRILNTQDSKRFIPMLVTQGAGAVELATMVYGYNPLNMDLTGLQSITQNPKNIEKLVSALTEIYIEHEEWFSVGPFARAFAEAGTIVMTVNSFNKSRAQIITEEMQRKMEEEKMRAYKDPDDNSSSFSKDK